METSRACKAKIEAEVLRKCGNVPAHDSVVPATCIWVSYAAIRGEDAEENPRGFSLVLAREGWVSLSWRSRR